MRSLVYLLVVVAVAFGLYYFSIKKMPVTDTGTAPTQAISLTGVRSDLLQIAQAERGHIALQGSCASLDELISSGSLTMNRDGRDGYTYSIDCSPNSFRVTAQHPPAPAGSGIRYPNLTISPEMVITEAP